MADASQQPSDRRLAVEAQRGEGASRFPFLLTDDLRSPWTICSVFVTPR